MPELPEVEVVRGALAQVLVGRCVTATRARPVRLRRGIEPAEWQALVGRRLESVERRGKYLLLDFGERTAVLHLGMSGRLLLRTPGSAAARHTHLVLEFTGDIELHLVDPRRFGTATVVPAAGLAEVAELACLGPDALGEEMADALVRAAARSRAPIRNLLLDQRVVAGVGNIYATEALARAGIHPARQSRRLGRARLDRLATALRTVLREAVAAGGTTLADGGFQGAEGNPGTFAVDLQVYGKAGIPCGQCGAVIRRLGIGGRSAYFCPRCQR